MVINHLEKLFVTNNAATIIKELDVVHPAAKMAVLASQMQEQEVCSRCGCSLCTVSLFLPRDLSLAVNSPLILYSFSAQCGDGTNIVVILIGELLSHAQTLLEKGLHPSDIISGYERAGQEAQRILESRWRTSLEALLLLYSIAL